LKDNVKNKNVFRLGKSKFVCILNSDLRMPNSLHKQPSPYLNELAEQPVEWHPWEDQVFELAQKLDKPIIISIGYSSCHWCRQMSRENYEDDYIASIMNRHFICIKVDREERPDVDHLYMESARMFNQSAGWPLHAFCLPNGSPFWCGTFFPKTDIGQDIAPWPQVLMRIAEHFRKNRQELEENGRNALANLSHSNNASITDPRDWGTHLLIHGCKSLCDAHDDKFGGFTPAPKFPSSMKIDFLLSITEANALRNNTALNDQVNNCLDKTLGAMANEALFDHVHGGFFRYALDQKWKSPHFEKMLSDNALLVSTYARSFRKFKKNRDRKIVVRTLNWIEEELGSQELGFANSISAEFDQMEGAFYLWTEKELSNVLGEKLSKDLILTWGTFAETPNKLYLPRIVIQDRIAMDILEDSLEKLRLNRNGLSSPQKDEKRSCSQHALLVRAYVDAGIAFSDKILIKKAECLLKWMESSFKGVDGTVLSILYPDHQQSHWGFLEDYAHWTEAMLAFASICEGFDIKDSQNWFEKSEILLEAAVEKFKDTQFAGFYTSDPNMLNACLIPQKQWYDHSMPSGNSSLLRCFHTLSLFGKNREKWKKEFQEAIGAYPIIAQRAPDGIGHALAALTDSSIGVIKVTMKPESLQEFAFLMGSKPHRSVYLFTGNETSIEVNGRSFNFRSQSMQELIDEIWN